MIAAFSRQGDVERAVEVLARMGVDENLVIDEAVFQEKRRCGQLPSSPETGTSIVISVSPARAAAMMPS